MYQVIDPRSGNCVDSEHDDFEVALDACLELAELQADDDIEVDTFVNGSQGPWPCSGAGDGPSWEAGAGPDNDPCAYWPHVEWKE